MSGAAPPALEPGDRRELLRIARVTLKEWLATGRTPPGAPHRAPLLQPAGAFVTLNARGELRGCIGHVEATTPLYRTIVDLAVSAATRDPRFPPLRKEELPEVRISISVLSARWKVSGPSEIEVGRHGVMVTRGAQRGLLLPQVGSEHHLTPEAFLAETCRKAGLQPDAWQDGETVIEVFTADVFEEEEEATPTA